MSEVLLAFIAWGEENPICFTILLVVLIDGICGAFSKFLKSLVWVQIKKEKGKKDKDKDKESHEPRKEEDR